MFASLSCSKDSNETTKLLTKESSKGRNKYDRYYNYDNSGNLISIDEANKYTAGSSIIYKFYYTDGKLSSMMANRINLIYEFNHYKDSLVVKQYRKPDTLRNLLYVFHINKNGIFDSIYKVYGKGFRFLLDKNNNFIKYSFCDASNYCNNNSKYDNMTNIYSSLPIEYRIISNIEYNMINDYNLGKNNVINCSNYFGETTFEYEYDSDNFPKQCVIKYRNMFTDTVKYEYN